MPELETEAVHQARVDPLLPPVLTTPQSQGLSGVSAPQPYQ